jgi:catechol 2,3-dioxygenase
VSSATRPHGVAPNLLYRRQHLTREGGVTARCTRSRVEFYRRARSTLRRLCCLALRQKRLQSEKTASSPYTTVRNSTLTPQRPYMTTATAFFDMNAAPMRVGTVRLKVRDLGSVSAFYQKVLGLSPMDSSDQRITLGNGSSPLLELEGDPALTPHDRRQAGLFHTAFLMPSRADLARWLAHVSEARIPLQGASDHMVSEAIYLADSEGNGIEVYADRPLSRWRGADGQIDMTTDPLDIQDLLKAAADTKWAAFPADGMIGHVHLQVGDTEAADRFYLDVLGFEITERYPGASFYGSGGYHHQLAGNAWNSPRAGRRPHGMAGLDNVQIVVREPADIQSVAVRAESVGIEHANTTGGIMLRDPWGTAITIRT